MRVKKKMVRKKFLKTPNPNSWSRGLFWRVLSSNIFLFLVFLALILASWRLVGLTLKKQSLNQEVASLKQQTEQLGSDKEKLAQDLEYFSSTENLEKEARRRLNLKKPGESVVVVLPEEKAGSGPSLTNQSREIIEKESVGWPSNLKKWLQYFGLRFPQ